MQNTYEFQGQPLTPRIAKRLILEHFEGERTLQEFTRLVNEFHLDHGGCECISVLYNPVAVVLSQLTKERVIERLGRGLYRIPSHPSPSPDPDRPRTIGEGDGCVYVYYYPAYQRLAEYANTPFWPCKIGHTVQYNPNNRIIPQVGTAIPEYPEIGLIIRTDNPSHIERLIHGILKALNRHIENAPGTEWFLTNPNEVEGIYNNLQTLRDIFT